MNDLYETPCYIFDEDEFCNNINMFQNSLNKYFNHNSILGYSFKTNFLPYILGTAKQCDCYAEVVSSKEYFLAKSLNFGKNIIYNGPVKTKESFLDAIESGCIVNIDSEREICWLQKLDRRKKCKVGIRVNFDLEKELPGQTLMGSEGGRFGFCDDNNNLSQAIAKINKLDNVAISCLHMHVSSKSKSVDVYRALVRRACGIIRREQLQIEYIDVGGGFFGGGDNGIAYDKYVKGMKDELEKAGFDEVGIIVEPGASVVATSIRYLTEVVDVKDTTMNRFVIVDGSRLHIDPFFSKSTYSYELLSETEEVVSKQTIVGFTCMEKDRIIKLDGQKRLEEGDYVQFNMVGSYTMCMNSDFINSEPRVYAVSNGQALLIRKEKEIVQYYENCVVRENKK